MPEIAMKESECFSFDEKGKQHDDEKSILSSKIHEMQLKVDTIPCVSVENMRLSDTYTIANYVPSLELMHRAALGVFKAVSWWGQIAVVVGSGNNGGDGFALACILKEAGFDCTVFTLSNKLSPDSAYYAEKAELMHVPVLPFVKGRLRDHAVVVDCLLGTGFQGTPRDNYRAAIEEINASGAYVVSVDINSGMNGDTAEAEISVVSDLTVTIGFVKKGLVLPGAGNYMKRLVCADIGIVLLNQEDTITESSCPPWLDMEVIRTY